MLDFSGSEEFRPLMRVIGAKYLKVSLDFLIGSFNLSISLGVIGGGEVDIILKDPSKFSSKGQGKLGTMIRDNGVIKSKVFKCVVEKELSNSIRINSFGARSQYYPLCKAMVDHDHEGVITMRKGKVGDEVDRKLLEG